MKINIGRVSRGYQFSSLMLAAKAISEPPSPHNSKANRAATKPMAPNTRCPLSSSSSMAENIESAISSWLIEFKPPCLGDIPDQGRYGL